MEMLKFNIRLRVLLFSKLFRFQNLYIHFMLNIRI